MLIGSYYSALQKDVEYAYVPEERYQKFVFEMK